eukprot:NODE_413_length_7912_cov_0.917061.p11 type:complete len:108 gc:universal NODE_413_length_7912_cov_0.917061:7293-6970(-)
MILEFCGTTPVNLKNTINVFYADLDMKFSFLSVATPIILLPFAGITQYQWMKLFIGNANFVYAATLGWILIQGTAINDYLFAYKRKRMEDALEREIIEEPLEIALML